MNGIKAPLKFDKQLTIEIIVVVILLSVGIWLYFIGALNRAQKSISYAPPGDCLILEQKYCNEARLLIIDTEGTNGARFDLSPGVPIYMPFDGAYFDEPATGDPNQTMKLGIVDTSIFIVITGEYSSIQATGTFLKKGDVLATIKKGSGTRGETNLAIYGIDYEISDLFE